MTLKLNFYSYALDIGIQLNFKKNVPTNIKYYNVLSTAIWNKYNFFLLGWWEGGGRQGRVVHRK